MKWRPIGEAPRDSTPVLVCMNNGEGSILIAMTPGTGQWWTVGMRPIQTPTHWMPLPDPPEVG